MSRIVRTECFTPCRALRLSEFDQIKRSQRRNPNNKSYFRNYNTETKPHACTWTSRNQMRFKTNVFVESEMITLCRSSKIIKYVFIIILNALNV